MLSLREQSVKSLLLRELGKLNYREQAYLKESLDMRFIDEELRRLNQRSIRFRWLLAGLWVGFVSVLFVWTKFGIPETSALTASVLFLVFIGTLAISVKIETLRHRELIFKALRRLGQNDLSESEAQD
ncbi:MAG: hypothetical protein CMR00_12135 [[Chlorobium] sp. 445]|nr:MAG: hypothetical protein CMR00_12135 [[Chlorobium] sp. 445]